MKSNSNDTKIELTQNKYCIVDPIDYDLSYSTEEEAAEAYDQKAKQLFGDFAHLNFPEDR